MELLLGKELGEAYPAAQPKREERPRPFALPTPHTDMRRVYAYLMKRRHISREVVTHFARAGLLYEDAKYHNCVFVGTDEQGAPATPISGAPTARASPSRSTWRAAGPSTASATWDRTACSMCLRPRLIC
ncbi:MAG: DUF3991 domain-containing protein [Flavonifractor plautii]